MRAEAIDFFIDIEFVKSKHQFLFEPSGIERVHSVNVRGFAAVPTTPVVRPGYTVPEGDR